MEVLNIEVHVNRKVLYAKAKRVDEMDGFMDQVVGLYKSKFNHKLDRNDLISVISLNSERLVKLKGKVWDQLKSGEKVWIVLAHEWQDYYDKVVQCFDNHYRHGKKLTSRHPGALSPVQLKEFIGIYFDNGKEADVALQFERVLAIRKAEFESSKSPMVSPVNKSKISKERTKREIVSTPKSPVNKSQQPEIQQQRETVLKKTIDIVKSQTPTAKTSKYFEYRKMLSKTETSFDGSPNRSFQFSPENHNNSNRSERQQFNDNGNNSIDIVNSPSNNNITNINNNNTSRSPKNIINFEELLRQIQEDEDITVEEQDDLKQRLLVNKRIQKRKDKLAMLNDAIEKLENSNLDDNNDIIANSDGKNSSSNLKVNDVIDATQSSSSPMLNDKSSLSPLTSAISPLNNQQDINMNNNSNNNSSNSNNNKRLSLKFNSYSMGSPIMANRQDQMNDNSNNNNNNNNNRDSNDITVDYIDFSTTMDHNNEYDDVDDVAGVNSNNNNDEYMFNHNNNNKDNDVSNQIDDNNNKIGHNDDSDEEYFSVNDDNESEDDSNDKIISNVINENNDAYGDSRVEKKHHQQYDEVFVTSSEVSSSKDITTASAIKEEMVIEDLVEEESIRHYKLHPFENCYFYYDPAKYHDIVKISDDSDELVPGMLDTSLNPYVPEDKYNSFGEYKWNIDIASHIESYIPFIIWDRVAVEVSTIITATTSVPAVVLLSNKEYELRSVWNVLLEYHYYEYMIELLVENPLVVYDMSTTITNATIDANINDSSDNIDMIEIESDNDGDDNEEDDDDDDNNHKHTNLSLDSEIHLLDSVSHNLSILHRLPNPHPMVPNPYTYEHVIVHDDDEEELNSSTNTSSKNPTPQSILHQHHHDNNNNNNNNSSNNVLHVHFKEVEVHQGQGTDNSKDNDNGNDNDDVRDIFALTQSFHEDDDVEDNIDNEVNNGNNHQSDSSNNNNHNDISELTVDDEELKHHNKNEINIYDAEDTTNNNNNIFNGNSDAIYQQYHHHSTIKEEEEDQCEFGSPSHHSMVDSTAITPRITTNLDANNNHNNNSSSNNMISSIMSPEIELKLQQQAEELKEANRARNDLEIRLQETRYLLQVFAGLKLQNKNSDEINAIMSEQLSNRNIPPKFIGETLDDLEASLEDASVESLQSGSNNYNNSNNINKNNNSNNNDYNMTRKGKFSDMYRAFKEKKRNQQGGAQDQQHSHILLPPQSPYRSDSKSGSKYRRKSPYSTYAIKKDNSNNNNSSNKKKSEKDLLALKSPVRSAALRAASSSRSNTPRQRSTSMNTNMSDITHNNNDFEENNDDNGNDSSNNRNNNKIISLPTIKKTNNNNNSQQQQQIIHKPIVSLELPDDDDEDDEVDNEIEMRVSHSSNISSNASANNDRAANKNTTPLTNHRGSMISTSTLLYSNDNNTGSDDKTSHITADGYQSSGSNNNSADDSASRSALMHSITNWTKKSSSFVKKLTTNLSFKSSKSGKNESPDSNAIYPVMNDISDNDSNDELQEHDIVHYDENNIVVHQGTTADSGIAYNMNRSLDQEEVLRDNEGNDDDDGDERIELLVKSHSDSMKNHAGSIDEFMMSNSNGNSNSNVMSVSLATLKSKFPKPTTNLINVAANNLSSLHQQQSQSLLSASMDDNDDRASESSFPSITSKDHVRMPLKDIRTNSQVSIFSFTENMKSVDTDDEGEGELDGVGGEEVIAEQDSNASETLSLSSVSVDNNGNTDSKPRKRKQSKDQQQPQQRHPSQLQSSAANVNMMEIENKPEPVETQLSRSSDLFLSPDITPTHYANNNNNNNTNNSNSKTTEVGIVVDSSRQDDSSMPLPPTVSQQQQLTFNPQPPLHPEEEDTTSLTVFSPTTKHDEYNALIDDNTAKINALQAEIARLKAREAVLSPTSNDNKPETVTHSYNEISVPVSSSSNSSNKHENASNNNNKSPQAGGFNTQLLEQVLTAMDEAQSALNYEHDPIMRGGITKQAQQQRPTHYKDSNKVGSSQQKHNNNNDDVTTDDHHNMILFSEKDNNKNNETVTPHQEQQQPHTNNNSNDNNKVHQQHTHHQTPVKQPIHHANTTEEENNKEVDHASPFSINFNTMDQSTALNMVISPLSTEFRTPVVFPTVELNIPEADPLLALTIYFKPLLVTEKYLENPNLKGLLSRQTMLTGIVQRELLFWCVFQLYGMIESGGVMVKSIKMTQVARALKDANIANILPSQLDLLLNKINANHANSPVKSSALMKPSFQAAPIGNGKKHPFKQPPQTTLKTGTAVAVQDNTHKADAFMPGFKIYFELMQGIAIFMASQDKKKTSIGGGGKKGNLRIEVDDSNHNASEVILFDVEEKFKDLLLKSQGWSSYEKMAKASYFSVSGILLKTPYQKYTMNSKLFHNINNNNNYYLSNSNSGFATEESTPKGKSHTNNTNNTSSALAANRKLDKMMHCMNYEDHAIELVKQVWDRNNEQIRQIYTFYADAQEIRRLGAGSNRLLASIENCKEMLTDFQVLPHIISMQDFIKLFRMCKLWEWYIADQLIAHQTTTATSTVGPTGLTRHQSLQSIPFSILHHQEHQQQQHQHHNRMPQTPKSPTSVHSHGHSNNNNNSNNNHNNNTEQQSATSSLSQDDLGGDKQHQSHHQQQKPAEDQVSVTNQSLLNKQHHQVSSSQEDPYDMKASVGNLSLTLWGFIELITRIACHQNKLGTQPHEALENLFHLMDASNGKAKLIKTLRKSVSIRHFVFSK